MQCIAFLKSTKIFQQFLETNHLEDKILESAQNTDQQEHDIGQMFIAIYNDFNSKLPSNLQNKMYSIFGFTKFKIITTSQTRKLFRKQNKKQFKCIKSRI